MSSNEEDLNDGTEASQSSKKRRIQRACDVCRRKKSDGVQMPGNRCSNCITYNLDCTYVETAKKRGPPKAYVETLENRVEKLEGLLRHIMPDIDLNNELELSSASNSDRWNRQTPENVVSCLDDTNPVTDAAVIAIRKWDSLPRPDEDTEHIQLADNMKKLAIDPRDFRFFGKSSGAMLVKTAIDLKHEFTGRETDMDKVVLGERRPHFWQPQPWESIQWEGPSSLSDTSHPIYSFPEPDLLSQLINAYFEHVNIFLPLLHRPTFDRSMRERLHYQDDMFAAVVLLVCAVASRFVDDPRVLLDGVDSWHSCGWRYFDKVHMVRKSFLSPPTLYDLQFYCLSVQFLQGTSAPHSCWTMVGIGIRLAQDVGAHRRKSTKSLTVEDELWKRAFWVLVCMDRMLSTGLGRPCAIQDEDFDLDMPVEVDDEYWEHPDPAMAFRQPPGKPSTVSAFNVYIRLNVLLSMALRTIYAINKSKIILGFAGVQWEQHIVAELDSALNRWVDSVPDHLRWDPNRENELFFNQSVMLYSHYYLVQILIHRPFIPSPRKPSPLAFPSLAICTNAARSASHVIDVQRRRKGHLMPFSQISVFTAGIVLLLNIWGGKRSGLSTDPNKEMADVYKCMQVLKAHEERWHSAGRLWDILYELASVGELPLPKASPPSTNKRERGADSPMSVSGTSESSPTLSVSDLHSGSGAEGRTFAGSRRVSSAVGSTSSGSIPVAALLESDVPARPSHTNPSPLSNLNPLHSHRQSAHSNPNSHSEPSPGTQLFSLPMYSDELGRLPLHGQVNFSSSMRASGSGSGSGPVQQWYTGDAGAGGGMGVSGVAPGGVYASSSAQGFYDYPYGDGGASGSNQAPGYSTSQPPRQVAGPSTGMIPNSHANREPNLDMTGMPVNMEMNGSGMQPMTLDNDTFAMWSNAPSGFELDDWGTYLTNVSELTQGINRAHGT